MPLPSSYMSTWPKIYTTEFRHKHANSRSTKVPVFKDLESYYISFTTTNTFTFIKPYSNIHFTIGKSQPDVIPKKRNKRTRK
jgi:hypothetical protein